LVDVCISVLFIFYGWFVVDIGWSLFGFIGLALGFGFGCNIWLVGVL